MDVRLEASLIGPHSPESRYQLEMSKGHFSAILYTTKCSTEMPAFHDQGRVDSGLRMNQCRKIAQSNRKVCQYAVPPYVGLANVTM